MHRTFLVLAFAACLYGCVQPRYNRPALPVPPEWPESTASQAGDSVAPEAADMKWREFFTDRQLQTVIDLALANNRDFRMAMLNVEKVQALYRIQRAELYPAISVSGEGQRYRVSENMAESGQAYTEEQHYVGVGMASWELDFFGRIRSLKSRALEQFFATEQARSAAQISLIAAVANGYLSLAADRENLRLAQTTLDAVQASYELILQIRNAGIGSDLDLRQAQSQVEAARVDIARFTGQVALDENLLNFLVGTPVASSLLPSELGADSALKDISAGLPSEVLLRRPDILMAEHQLKATYGNIGAARAAFFPRISLTTGAGFMSGDLSNLFESQAKTWTFVPQLVIPVFDTGARRANLKVAKVQRELAIAEYEKAIQSAFREVSDSLTLRTTLMEQEDAERHLVDALNESYRLAEARYKAGIDSYLTVLVEQRALYRAQQALVNLRMARMANLVTLYKVLGGGA